MFNFEKITTVLVEELGEVGAEAVCDAVNYYLLHGSKDMDASDHIILYALLYAMHCNGIDFSKPDHSALIELEYDLDKEV